MPDTEAGRALHATNHPASDNADAEIAAEEMGLRLPCTALEAIDAIERQAAARALAKVRERVEGLPSEFSDPYGQLDFDPDWVDRAAVLAAIEEASRG